MSSMKRNHIMVLVAMCMSIGASVGLITSIGGLFITPIADEFGVGRGSASLNMTIVNLVCGLGGTLMPRIMNKKNYKPLVFLFVILTVASSILLSFVHSMWLMYILNGIRGFTTGFLGIVASTVIIGNWFLKNTAMITSVAMAFSGVAGAIFSPIFSSIIQNQGWRTGYLISGIIMAVLYLPVMFFKIGLSPEDVNATAYGEEEGHRKVTFTQEHMPKAQSRLPIGLFIAAAVFSALSGFIPSLTPHYTGISVAYGFSVGVGATMLSITMVVNTAGKLLLGFLIDRMGLLRSLLLYFVGILIGIILMLTIRNVPIFYLASALIGLSSASCTVGPAMMCREAFGLSLYASTYPKISMFCTVMYAFATTINGLIYDATKSYTMIFWLMLACVFICVACVFIITGNRFRKK